MNLRQLEAFAAVLEAGSFSGGARALGLGQPTVSTHVASLEKALGLSLFERAGRRIRPTRAGSALLVHARGILSARRRAEGAMQEFREGRSGELLLSASTMPATYLLPKWIRAFRKRHPGAVVRVRTGDTREALRDLEEGRSDLAVVGNVPEPRDRFRTSRVGTDRLVLAVPEGHPLARSRGVHPADLKGLDFLLREKGSGTRASTEKALRAAGVDPGDLRTVCELGSTEALREAVKEGLGVAVLSVRAVEGCCGLKAVPLRGFEDERAIWMASLAGAIPPPLAKAFREQVGRG